MKKLLTLLLLTAAIGVCAAHAADAPEASIVVAQDGSGDYTRVQDAVDAAPTDQTARTIIYIKPGTYYTGGNRRSYHKECVIIGTTDFIYSQSRHDHRGRTGRRLESHREGNRRYSVPACRCPAQGKLRVATPERARVVVTTDRELTRIQPIVCHIN